MPLRPWRTFTTGATLAACAALLTTLVVAAGTPDLALDFRAAYLPAAEAVLEEGSPYVVNERSPDGISGAYLYPPQLALALVPATLLSPDVAAFVAFLAALAAVLGALALLGVRDLRCYAIVIVWAPAWQALQMANVSAVLVLALALVWRYRDHAWKSAPVLGVAVSLKLFLGPMLVWALASGRSSLAIRAVTFGFSATLLSWAAIGFKGLGGYPDVLRAVPEQPSYSIVAVVENMGYPIVAGYALTLGLGFTLLMLAVGLALRGEDLRAFALAIGASLALTPILWWHYLALLVVPLAVARPRFSPLWLLPVAVWSSRIGIGHGLETAVPLLVVAVVLAAIVIRPAPLELRPGLRPELQPAG